MNTRICLIWLVALFLIEDACIFYCDLVKMESGLDLHSQTLPAKENEDAKDEIKLNKDYLKRCFSDTKHIITSPLHWTKSDYIKASIVAGLTGGLYFNDQNIKNWAQKNRNNVSNKIAGFAKPFGNGVYTIPPLGLAYVLGYYNKNRKAQRTALLSVESFVISGGFVTIIKSAGHRHRPSSGDSYNTWDGPSFSTANLSFPSGHSSSAFSIATIIASEYKNIRIVPPLAYAIATLTALSRINDNEHWASDAFFGAAAGYFTSKTIMHLHSGKNNKKISFGPTLNPNRAAFSVSFIF